MKFVIFIVLFLVTRTVAMAQENKCIFYNDSTTYKCRIKKIEKISGQIYLLTLITKAGQNKIKCLVLTMQNEKYKKLKKIRRFRSYPMQLVVHDEPLISMTFIGDHYNVTTELPYLAFDKVVKVTQNYFFPEIHISPNVAGNRYIPSPPFPDLMEVMQTDTAGLFGMVRKFISSFDNQPDDSLFYSLVDESALRKNMQIAFGYKHKIDESTCLPSFFRDSIYHPYWKLDSIYFNRYKLESCPTYMQKLMPGKTFSADIILCRDSCVNIRVKWKTGKDYVPKSAVIAVKRQDGQLKIVAFIQLIFNKLSCPCE